MTPDKQLSAAEKVANREPEDNEPETDADGNCLHEYRHDWRDIDAVPMKWRCILCKEPK